MKILMLTPYPPYPPDSGGRIRQWEQIRYFGSRHDLTVLGFAFSQEEYDRRRMLDGLCAEALILRHPQEQRYRGQDPADLNLPWPLRWFYTDEMRNTIQRLKASQFDCVLIEYIFMSPYLDLFSCPAVLHEQNIESSLYKQYAEVPERKQGNSKSKDRLFWHATWMMMAQYENQTWPKFPLRIAVSSADKEEMDARCVEGKTVVIENGVNAENATVISQHDSNKILFMGSMDYYPNVDAAFHLVKHIMPHVWKRNPAISVRIVGRNPQKSILDLGSDPRVEVIANPANMREVAEGCALSVVPLRMGGGTRIKILDSMAMGLPVISTSLGCKGLSLTNGQHLLTSDDPVRFAEHILQVLDEPQLKEFLSRQGRALVEAKFGWRTMFERMEQELLQLVDCQSLSNTSGIVEQ